jgi:hypothetical protein
MKHTSIYSIKKLSYGHWEIVVSQNFYKRKYPFSYSSTKYWRYTTTDSMAIDDYRSDDDRRSKRGLKQLIRITKLNGVSTNKSYRYDRY